MGTRAAARIAAAPWACPVHRGLEPEGGPCRFFEIGMGRSASRSIWQAVCRLGIKAMHGTGGCLACVEDYLEKVEAGRVDTVVYSQYDYCGHLGSIHWRQLAEEYPEAKFILPLRPLDQWAKSLWAHHKGHTRDNRRRLLNRKVWFGLTERPTLEQVREGIQRHTDSVIQYFEGTKRLIVLNVFEEKDVVLWRRLAQFLEVEKPPKMKFPKKDSPIKVYRPKNKDRQK